MGRNVVPPVFFATDVLPIIQTEEFARVNFCFEGQVVSIFMTPAAFRAMTLQIIEGPPLQCH